MYYFVISIGVDIICLFVQIIDCVNNYHCVLMYKGCKLVDKKSCEKSCMRMCLFNGNFLCINDGIFIGSVICTSLIPKEVGPFLVEFCVCEAFVSICDYI